MATGVVPGDWMIANVAEIHKKKVPRRNVGITDSEYDISGKQSHGNVGDRCDHISSLFLTDIMASRRGNQVSQTC